MAKIYKRYCNTCKKYYEGQGKHFCSIKCSISVVKRGFILNNQHKLSDGTWYPKIPSLCLCGCNEVVWSNDEWVSGHNSRIDHPMKGHIHSDKIKEIIKIANTKTFLLDSEGNKEIYPPIPITCQCKNIHCNEICYNGRDFVSGHNGYIDGRSRLPYCFKFNDELKESIRLRDNRTCQLCGAIQNDRRHSVHHIHYDKPNCYPDLVCLCRSCNAKVNFNRKEYESLFMNKLNDRQLLFWTRRRE